MNTTTIAQQGHFRLTQSLGEEHIGLEARAQQEDHMDTRLWLRLFSLTEQIQQRIRQMLRQQFDTTLPRFDFPDPLDRRSLYVRLTPKGRKQFRKMAQAHEQLLGELFAGLPRRDKDALYEHLGHLRVQMAAQSATSKAQ